MPPLGFSLPSPPLLQRLSQPALNFRGYPLSPLLDFEPPLPEASPSLPDSQHQHRWRKVTFMEEPPKCGTVENTLYTSSHVILTKLSKEDVTLIQRRGNRGSERSHNWLKVTPPSDEAKIQPVPCSSEAHALLTKDSHLPKLHEAKDCACPSHSTHPAQCLTWCSPAGHTEEP